MWQTLLLVALCVAPASSQLTLRDQTCDADRKRVNVQTVNANVLIGGLFDIRGSGTDGTGCGLPTTEFMQVYEAARWTIKLLNDNNYVNGARFGMVAFDTCGQKGSALTAVQEFYPQSAGRAGTSSAGAGYCSKSTNVYKLGLIGPMNSAVSMAVGEMLPRIPASTISMRSTSPSLSNKNLYPTFLRTDQSASTFARAVSKMFKELQWEKIVIVYGDDAYGVGGYQEVLRAAYEAEVCVSGAISVPHLGPDSEYEEKLRNIASYGATAAVFFGNPTDAVSTMKALQSLQQGQAAIRNIKWMFSELDLDVDYSMYTAAQGAILAMASTTTINDFKTFFTNLNINSPPAENPWLQDWYMNRYQCKLPGANYATYSTTCDTTNNPRTLDYVQNPYVEQTVLAIMAYAEAIKKTCPIGFAACNTIKSMSPLVFHETLRNTDVTFPNTFVIPELRGRRVAFDVNGDPLTSAYTFYNYLSSNGRFSFQQFATYNNGNLQVASTPAFPRTGSSNLPVESPCFTGGCSNCLQPAGAIALAYKPGDLIVAALVNAHEPNQQGLDCGRVIPDRLIDAVAARYAANRAASLSRGVSMGYLIVDVCPGLQAAQSFLTNLLGGYHLYTDSEGNVITTSNIIAFLDMTPEDTAWRIAPILASLNIPQIRVAPTSSMLLHNPRYPNLISAVPSQTTVHLALLQMLSRLNWKYVQIVSEASGSYYRAAENFRRAAILKNICVAMWSTFDMDPVATVNHMREIQDAPVVVVFGTSTHLQSLLQAVKTVTNGQTAQRQLTFVSGSEELGTSDNVIAGFANEFAGSLTIQLAENSDTGMGAWLTGLRLTEIVDDKFLAKWFENKFSCSLTSSSRWNYDQVCSTGITSPLTTGAVYQGYAPYIIKGIDSVAAAISSILDRECVSGSTGICAAFRGVGNIGGQIVDILRDSDGSNGEFQITDGEGMSDLLLYNYNNAAFTNVGRFDSDTRHISSLNPQSILTATGARADSVSTQCSGRCAQCQYAFAYQEFGYVPGDWLIAGTFSISNPGPVGQQPYVCGEIRTTNGFQYSAAMMYALNRINSGLGPVKLNNVTLGGLILDHCNNDRRAYGQVSDVYSGLMEVAWSDAMGEGSRFMSTDVLAWLTDNTASTHEAAEILQPLGVSIVSPSATAASLLDNPTFFRTIQGDGTTAIAIVKLCKTLGFNFIQVVHSASSYGREGRDMLISAARAEGLCVINSFEMADESDAGQIITTTSSSSSRVVVLYMGTSLTTAFLTEAAKLTTNQLTIISPEPYTSVVTTTTGKDRLANLLSLQLQNPQLTDFLTFLNSAADNDNNPFFARFYMKLFQCNLPGYYMYPADCTGQRLTTSSAFASSNYALSTINAVYAVAAALQTTLVEFCGDDYTSQCLAFRRSDDVYNRFVENLKIIEFTDPSSRLFQFLEREGNVVYDVLRFNGAQYDVVGTYGGASLVLNNPAQMLADYSSVVSQCSVQCSECVFNNVEFSYTPGDIYLGGVFDVHTEGPSVFDCGNINTEHGFQLLEAFHFALQQVNAKQGEFADILNGVTLGGVGLDTCQSAIRGGYLVSNINNGLTTLERDGEVVSPEEIDLYVGPYSSDSSIYLARILTDLEIPQISYAATSNSLGNQFKYPFFFRTIPADDKQVLGMLNYLDKTNLRYVQLLYTDDSYGRDSVAQFDLLLSQSDFSICVAQRVMLAESGVLSEESANDVVIRLLQKPVANTVVVFAGTRYIRAILRAVEQLPRAAEIFKFVGPTTWGNRESVTMDLQNAGNDAVTFALDLEDLSNVSRPDTPDGFLMSYLTKRNPTNARNNPWFEEWFQNALGCYTSPSNVGRYSRACGPNEDLSRNLQTDSDVLHVINAVYSAAFALHTTLKEKCGSNYAAVCEAYRNSKDRRTSLRDNLDRVNFTDPTKAEFRFVSREGNKGYKLFKWTSISTTIGTFSSDGVLDLDMDLVPKYDGSCERKDSCVECPTIRNRGVRYAVGGDLNANITLVGVFDIHNRGTELYQCGSLNMEGFLQFLAFFWTYSQDADNKRVRLLALDTCSSSLRAGQDLYSLLKDGTLCNSDYFGRSDLEFPYVGAVVVGGEENTAAATRVLEPQWVTYVSSDSVSPLMDRYQYLLRARTPWSGFVTILSKFLDDSGWTYVNSMYVDSGMGLEEYTVFQEVAGKNDICLNGGLALPEDATDADIRTALAGLESSSGANVVVLFSEPDLSMRILQLAQQIGIADDFLWILAVDDPELVNIIPAGATFQALVMRPRVPSQDDFYQFVENLVYDGNNNNRNRAGIPRVWWEDFYQTVHRCKLSDARYQLEFDNECALDLTINNFDAAENKVVYYMYLASIFSMSGLRDFNQRCASDQECLSRLHSSPWLIRDDILDVQLQSAGLTSLSFNKQLRYIKADYDIYRLNVEDGVLQQPSERFRSYEQGNFVAYNLALNTKSTCLRADGCGCKRTDPFAQGQTGSEFTPTVPRNYYKYNTNGDLLYTWPIWAIAVAVLTCVGLLVTIIIFLYLLFFYPVKGGTSILGYLTIVGIMGIYAINFAFFQHASAATCGARRFMMGVVYIIVFAALLVKAVDNWRFADMEYSNHQYRGLTSSVTLFLIALGIILMQCIIPIEWLILVHPTASKWSTLDYHDYWWCDPPELYDVGLVCSFIFVMFIVLLTAIFAALAWDSESNNRESRWILVAAIATAGCFLVWMIVTTNAGPVYRDPAIAIANCVNATLLLILIPIRKLHLLYLSKNEKPEVYADGFDPYSNVYTNQSYDPEADDYTYEPTEKADDGFIAD